IEKLPKGEVLSQDILSIFICANTERDPHFSKTNGKTNGEHSRPMSDRDISQLMIEMLMAGIEPVVYEEIDRIFDDDKTRPITYSDIEKMVYTEACIKETLRIMSVVPFLYKRALKDDT
ncbi:13469_t:CDS:2, partial [Racocetra fulgida]